MTTFNALSCNSEVSRIDRLKKRLMEREHFKCRVKKELSLAKDTAHLPNIIRKAMALALLLKEMPIYIFPDELIVGCRTIFSFPDYLAEEELASGIPVRDQTYSHPFDRPYNHCQDKRGYGVVEGTIPAHRNVLNMGILGLKQEAQTRREQSMATDEKRDRCDFYESMIIVADATISFGERFSALAKSMAEKETSPVRRGELETISRISKNVPAHPPESFYEAVQSIYLIHLITWCEGHFLVPLGRLDQYLYPFYRKDIERGTITGEKAQELLECLWLKLNADSDYTHGGLESDTGQNVTLGGISPQGEDTTNELSYMCIKATAKLRLTEPKLMVRLHRNSPKKFWESTCELAKLGTGFPLFSNDDVVVGTLERSGYSLTDARDYSNGGCWELVIPGRSNDRTHSGKVNFLQCLEWTLNDGKNLLDNQKLGLDCNTEDLKSFSHFMSAYKAQITHFVEQIVSYCNQACFSCAPFLSLTVDDCMEKGKDISSGGARYNNNGIFGSGAANTANSLLAIKKYVYDDRMMDLGNVGTILREDFANNELLR